MSSKGNNSIIQELAMIAHEFRCPVDTISKSAELIKRTKALGNLDDQKLLEIMDGISNNCNRLSNLTTQILAIAQLENGTSKLIIEKLNIVDFIEKIKEAVISLEKHYNIKFKFNIKVNNPDVSTDFKKLEGILLNLISNAIKYSRATARSISVKVHDTENIIYFSVKDRGIGIPLCEQENIFTKFHRVEGFTTRQTEGCGLGLTIVKNFTEILGGKISVNSVEGKGSEFIVEIPRALKVKKSPIKVLETDHYYELYKSTIDQAFANI